MVDLAAEPSRVGGRIQEVALEPVEVLQSQRYAIGLSVIGNLTENFLAPFPLVVSSSDSACGELAEAKQLFGRRESSQSRMERSAKVSGSGSGSAINGDFQSVDGSLTEVLKEAATQVCHHLHF